MNRYSICIATILIAAAYGQEYPQAEIANKWIRANLYLPDSQKGYYRATRFDWSGVIQSLRFSGHEYFGPRLPKHDPLVNNSISGPVESFNANLGYAEAQPGGSFMRIGIGILEKPAAPDPRPASGTFTYVTYKVLDAGVCGSQKAEIGSSSCRKSRTRPATVTHTPSASNLHPTSRR